MEMKRFVSVLAALGLACASTLVLAQENEWSKLPWQVGPITAHLGDEATLRVSDGYQFLDIQGTRRFNELAENPSDGSDEYTLAGNGWVAFFSYGDVGYVKDDDTIDPDTILSNIRKGTAEANLERRKRGWGEMSILGWNTPPEYDSQLKTLTWSILGESTDDHKKVVNYNARLLGRHGVMSVVLVTGPDKLASAIRDFKDQVQGFQYVAGETYSEYQPGDHVAAYGLAALITGGAAAVAAKKGLFTVIGGFLIAAWKFALAGLVAVGAWLKSLFNKKR